MRKGKKTENLTRLLGEVANALYTPFDSWGKSGKLPGVPNKRKPGKEFIGGYVSRDLKKKFKQVARKEAEGDARKMLMKLVVEGLRKRGIDVEEEGK